jgi:hypothetical protein
MKEVVFFFFLFVFVFRSDNEREGNRIEDVERNTETRRNEQKEQISF